MSEQEGSSPEGSTPENIYIPVTIADEIEDIEYYCLGGFAPVTIGDKLRDGRYSIVAKLGAGGIAMVWLCYDDEQRTWCAIKINAAHNSSINCGDLKTIRLMRMKGIDNKVLEANHILISFETFWEYSPNGKHLCTVMPVLGPRLCDWRGQDVGNDAARANKLCYQVAKGMRFLHQIGLVHNDFRPQNILMRLKPSALDLLSKEAMSELLGEPREVELLTVSGNRSMHAPQYVLASASWEYFSRVVTDDIAIVDFGEAYPPDLPPSHFGIPSNYASPEIVFAKTSTGFASDIWSLALTLMEVRLNNYGGYGGYGASYAVRFMERFVGTIPPTYRSAVKRLLIDEGWRELERRRSGDRRPFLGPVEIPITYEEECECENTAFVDRLMMKLASEQECIREAMDPNDRTGRTWRRTKVRCHVPEDEVRQLGNLLHQMLKYDPSERMTIEEVLQHPWFQISREQDPVQRDGIVPREAQPEHRGIQIVPQQARSLLSTLIRILSKAALLWPIFIRLLVLMLLGNISHGLYTWLHTSHACAVTMVYLPNG
ncbi:kinase-like protein [Xylariaceae sp. FL0594]|nr:kinase-like protein [Xylariaceae sp. FL0594]